MSEALRPRDLALLLLACGDTLPRQRARDQQADRAGLGLKQRLLHGVLERDPDPGLLEETLMDLVADLGPPTGPTRSLALALVEDWEAFRLSPTWREHLLNQAVRTPVTEEGARGGQLPG
jgi:hypothetical protein